MIVHRLENTDDIQILEYRTQLRYPSSKDCIVLLAWEPSTAQVTQSYSRRLPALEDIPPSKIV